MIHFITGVGASGKSSIIPFLKQKLPNCSIYDFDAIGVPENADKKWRQKSTEQWIQKIASEKNNVYLLGQMILGEIVACPSFKDLKEFRVYMLDCSDSERIKRMKNRGDKEPYDDMLHWASWNKQHLINPSINQHVIKDNAWDNLDFSKWDSLKTWNSITTSIKIIDTTNMTLNEVASAIIKN
jgi:dephospho-CoA kinase